MVSHFSQVAAADAWRTHGATSDEIKSRTNVEKFCIAARCTVSNVFISPSFFTDVILMHADAVEPASFKFHKQRGAPSA